MEHIINYDMKNNILNLVLGGSMGLSNNDKTYICLINKDVAQKTGEIVDGKAIYSGFSKLAVDVKEKLEEGDICIKVINNLPDTGDDEDIVFNTYIDDFIKYKARLCKFEGYEENFKNSDIDSFELMNFVDRAEFLSFIFPSNAKSLSEDIDAINQYFLNILKIKNINVENEFGFTPCIACASETYMGKCLNKKCVSNK